MLTPVYARASYFPVGGLFSLADHLPAHFQVCEVMITDLDPTLREELVNIPAICILSHVII